MRRLQVLAVVGIVTAGLAVALWSIGPAYTFPKDRVNLSALPGCAGQCHVKGGFVVDPRTGRKHFAGGGGGGVRFTCTERIARGPVFSQRQRICCDDAGNCKTTNLGAIGNEGGVSPAASCKTRCMQQSDHCNAMNGGVQSINGCGIKREICLSKC